MSQCWSNRTLAVSDPREQVSKIKNIAINYDYTSKQAGYYKSIRLLLETSRLMVVGSVPSDASYATCYDVRKIHSFDCIFVQS